MWELVVECWKFADRMLSPSFKAALEDRFAKFEIESRRYPLEEWRDMHTYTKAPSGLKRLLVDMAVFQWKAQDFKPKTLGCGWRAFLAETTVRALEVTPARRMGKKPWVNAGCKYHDHGDDKLCYKTMF